MKRNIAILGFMILLASIAFYQNGNSAKPASTASQAAAFGGVKLNAQAPEIQLTSLDGRTYSIGGTRSKPQFVNFWASWCGPCEEEAPSLKNLSEKYGDRVDFYALNVTAQDKPDNVKQFVKQYEWKMPVLLDSKGEAANLYRIQGIPTTFLIDEKGIVKDAFNFLPPEEMEKRIKRLIR